MEVDTGPLQSATKFSREVLNIVYNDHSVPRLVGACSTSYKNVGTFVISLIKGELRDNFSRNTRRVLERPKTNDEIADILMRFPELYFRENPRDNMTILKAIAFIAMYSIFYHLRDVGRAQVYAHNAVVEMLITLEDGHFIERGGLALLKDHAERLLNDQEEFLIAFEEGTYPW